MYTNVKVNVLEYASIIHAVKTYIRKLGENQTLRKLANPLIRENIHKVMKCKKSKFFNDILNNNTSVTTGKRRWNELLDIEDMEWKLIHKLHFIMTKNCKLQWFQYRIINKILATTLFYSKLKK